MEWLEGCGTLCVRSDCIRGVKKENEHRDAEAQRYLFLVNQLNKNSVSLCLCVPCKKYTYERSGLLYFESRWDGGVYALPAPMQDK